MSKKSQIQKEQLERFYFEHQGRVRLIDHWEPAEQITNEKVDSVHVAMRGLAGVEEITEMEEQEWQRIITTPRIHRAMLRMAKEARDEETEEGGFGE